jgi:copper chaperone CopZ
MQRALMVLMICFLAMSVSFAEGNAKIAIDGMKCKECVEKVEKALKGIEGVKGVKVSLKNKSAEVMFASNAKVETSKLVNAVAEAGFTATSGNISAAPKKAHNESCTEKEAECKENNSDCCKEGKAMKNKDTMKESQEKKTEKK